MQPKNSGRIFYAAVTMVIVCSLIGIGWLMLRSYIQQGLEAHKKAPRPAEADFLIDAEIPGTEVYFRDKLLGTTPLSLSRSECASVGLPVSAESNLDDDGWGEGLLFHDSATDKDFRLMLKVPSSRAAEYLTIETPWGSRTKLLDFHSLPGKDVEKFPNWAVVGFMSRDQNGVGVGIEFVNKPLPSDKVLKVQVTVSNNGTHSYSGCQPEVQLLWGTFDLQWQQRSGKTFPLEPKWANFVPGQKLQTTVELPVPEAAGEYSVFAVFNLFKDENKKHFIGMGSVYSDSKLLHIP